MPSPSPFQLSSSPFLRVPFDSTLWKRNALGSKEWFSLNIDHAALRDFGAYAGVLQAELTPKRAGDASLTLGVHDGEQNHVLSLSFGDGAVSFAMPCDDACQWRALKLARELLHHLPDAELRSKLCGRLDWELEKRGASLTNAWLKL